MSTPLSCWRCLGRPCKTGHTGAKQLQAGDADADHVGVEVEPTTVVLEKVAAAWQVRYLLTAKVGFAGCRSRTLARRRVDDPVIAGRALIAPILAPRVAGCTKRRRWSGSNLCYAPNRARCRGRRVSARSTTVVHYAWHRQACVSASLHACDAWHGYGCAHTRKATPRCLRRPEYHPG